MRAICLSLLFIIAFHAGHAQRRAQPKKDTLKLTCPMQDAVMKSPSQEGYGYKGDVKMIISGSKDTSFRSPVDGKIDLINIGEGGKYEIVMFHNDYNIWFIGISKPFVKKNDTVKSGQPIGKVNPGDEIEFLLFDDEEPIDPGKYLDCKKQ